MSQAWLKVMVAGSSFLIRYPDHERTESCRGWARLFRSCRPVMQWIIGSGYYIEYEVQTSNIRLSLYIAKLWRVVVVLYTDTALSELW